MKNPFILEINTWVWLNELTQRYDQAVTLSNIPSMEWDEIAAQGFHYLWLMGVWKRSPVGLEIALQHPGIINACQLALPGFRPVDMVASAYCVQDYSVDVMLGGLEGIQKARMELKARGMGLILDFVPNHVAPDHPWTNTHPEYFIQGTESDMLDRPDDFIHINGRILARARDPFYPPWPDVVQVNAFSGELRMAFLKTLLMIGSLCDGVRCDMAMLTTNRIFEQTWGSRAGQKPAKEFWMELIGEVKKTFPAFVFIAEVYWDMEWELQQQGFDFCYDKRLYDRLLHDSPGSLRLHATAGLEFQEKLLRFIENHDEPRISSLLDFPRHCAAAFIFATLPGARLFHQGQQEGNMTRIPVFLAKSIPEIVNHDLKEFYRNLLHLTSGSLFHDGSWALCTVNGWPDNNTAMNLLAWSWTLPDQRALVVINYSDKPAQGIVGWPWMDDPEQEVLLNDRMHDVSYGRSNIDLAENGLFVDLDGWNYHFFVI
ncbi:MAG: alpha-amylase family glycosyl hydrolase [Bacteroidales bacterium]|nr:hypothetical protein [Lentimicrobiaceae bacterium]MDD5696026.1 alpha-amylase family glycosyl hydrolase [Bacteroidales bacterium]